MIELHISEAAAYSIIEQADYFQQSANLSLGQKWESAVDEAVHSLRQWPKRGALCRFRSTVLTGLRWILVPGFSKHMVFYRYLTNEEVVLIVQVLHGARNLAILLDEGD